MSRDRLSMHKLQEFVRPHRMGSGCREVARLLKMSPNTERRYRAALEPTGLLIGNPLDLPPLESLKAHLEAKLPRQLPFQQTSSVEMWREDVTRWMLKGLTAQVIYDRLRQEQEGFSGSLSAVKRLYHRLKVARGIQSEDVAIPVETSAGEVAQVDCGDIGKLYDPDQGVLRRAYVFVMVLGFSRHMVARIVFDQKIETWLWLHVEAFRELGGVVRVVVPDNLKSAVIKAAFGVSDELALNQSYRELARHYGFKVDPTPPYSPEKKGKVEAGVKYVKENFFKGREEQDVCEVKLALTKWVHEIAGKRRHGTTGKRPLEVFEQQERETLLPLPMAKFETVVWKQATVHRDSHVVFGKRLYSAPWRLIGKKVWLRVTPNTVAIYCDDVRIATHERSGPGLRSTHEAHLPLERAQLRHRSRSFWVQRAYGMGETVGRYIEEVFDSDDVLSLLRTVQAMVAHLETFPSHRATAACERAMFFGNHSYQGLKSILRKGLDLLPLPQTPLLSNQPDCPPRYARTAIELLQQPLEVLHEPN